MRSRDCSLSSRNERGTHCVQCSHIFHTPIAPRKPSVKDICIKEDKRVEGSFIKRTTFTRPSSFTPLEGTMRTLRCNPSRTHSRVFVTALATAKLPAVCFLPSASWWSSLFSPTHKAVSRSLFNFCRRQSFEKRRTLLSVLGVYISLSAVCCELTCRPATIWPSQASITAFHFRALQRSGLCSTASSVP